MQKLSEIEQKQYARQISLAEIGVLGQQKLKNASVLVVGAGGLGCPVLQYLAATGVGKIGIADGDIVEISNIPRQILYTIDDVGKQKTLAAKSKIENFNKSNQIIVFSNFITNDNVQSIINQFDIIVDCTDNFDTRYTLNDACEKEKKPLIFASIYKFEGQVTVFDFKNNHSLRTLFPNKPDQETIPTCTTLGVLNTLCGIIGLFQANEVLKLILEIGDSLVGKTLTFNSLTLAYFIFSYSNQSIKTKNIHLIDSQDFKELLFSNPNINLIDVREKHEFLQYNLGGINVPFSDFENQKTKISTQEPIYLICKSGNKSKIIADKLAIKFPKLEIYSIVGNVFN